MTPIYIHEHPQMEQKEPLIQFINEKCDVSIPMLTRDEKVLIRKSGLAWVCIWTFLSMALIDLLSAYLPIGIIGILAGINSALDLSELSKYDIFKV